MCEVCCSQRRQDKLEDARSAVWSFVELVGAFLSLSEPQIGIKLWRKLNACFLSFLDNFRVGAVMVTDALRFRVFLGEARSAV